MGIVKRRAVVGRGKLDAMTSVARKAPPVRMQMQEREESAIRGYPNAGTVQKRYSKSERRLLVSKCSLCIAYNTTARAFYFSILFWKRRRKAALDRAFVCNC